MFSGTSIRVLGFSRTGDITTLSIAAFSANFSVVALLLVSSGSILGDSMLFISSSFPCEYGLHRRGFSKKAEGRKMPSGFGIVESVEFTLLSSLFFSSFTGEASLSLNG